MAKSKSVRGKKKRDSRFRKVDLRMWADEWFRGLSPIPPCGAGLWIYLLTGPETGIIPGLFRTGEAALAESLGWSIEDFRRAFAEVSAQGKVQADWSARTVWIPNAIKYNPPESPNVVKSWRVAWGEIPECPLKRQAAQAFELFFASMAAAFSENFAFVLDPSAKASGKPSRKASGNQEQEQEQEQEQDSPQGGLRLAELYSIDRQPIAIELAQEFAFLGGDGTSPTAIERARVVMDDLLSAGITAAAISAELHRSGRVRSEHPGDLRRRILPRKEPQNAIDHFAGFRAAVGAN